MRRVTVGGLVFHHRGAGVRSGYVLGPRGLTGWRGAAGIRRDETPRPSAHGSFDAQGFRDAKVPVLKGTIVAQSPTELDEFAARLEALLADGSKARMSVQDDRGMVTWQDVRLALPGTVSDYGENTVADFQIGFWSPLAELYGGLNSYSGASVNLFHRGTMPAPIKVRIPSAPASYTINGPGGRQFVVAGAPAGGLHEVDLRRARVTRDGVLLQGVVTRADTWDLPAGVQWAHSITAGAPDWWVPNTYA